MRYLWPRHHLVAPALRFKGFKPGVHGCSLSDSVWGGTNDIIKSGNHGHRQHPLRQA